MAVIRIRQSLKKRNESALEQQAAKEEITEIRDALIEIAEVVSAICVSTEQYNDKEVGGVG